jgi:hypothetical protein
LFGIPDERLDFNLPLYVPLAGLLLSNRLRFARLRDRVHTWARSLGLDDGCTDKVERPDPARKET